MGYKLVFPAQPAYALGSPSFATPHLGIAQLVLHANSYSLGSPAFAIPTLRAVHSLAANVYSIASPAFFAPAVSQVQHLFTNAMSLSALGFTPVHYIHNYQLSGLGFSVGPLIFTFNPSGIIVNSHFVANAYFLDSPRFNYPRLQVTAQPVVVYPLTYLNDVQQASAVLANLLNLLLMSIPPQSGSAADDARILIGAMRAKADAAIRSNTLGTDLQAIFDACFLAGSTYAGVEVARQYLLSQQASRSVFTQTLYRSALVMTMALESKVMAATKYVTQADAQVATAQALAMFDDAKNLGIDEVDAITYQTLNAMGGALTNHLARTQLQLPRYLTYTSKVRMPSLYLANRIYADASKYQEIEAENDVIHPAFVPQVIRVLSSATIAQPAPPYPPPGVPAVRGG
jgi:hypothetical protein